MSLAFRSQASCSLRRCLSSESLRAWIIFQEHNCHFILFDIFLASQKDANLGLQLSQVNSRPWSKSSNACSFQSQYSLLQEASWSDLPLTYSFSHDSTPEVERICGTNGAVGYTISVTSIKAEQHQYGIHHILFNVDEDNTLFGKIERFGKLIHDSLKAGRQVIIHDAKENHHIGEFMLCTYSKHLPCQDSLLWDVRVQKTNLKDLSLVIKYRELNSLEAFRFVRQQMGDLHGYFVAPKDFFTEALCESLSTYQEWEGILTRPLWSRIYINKMLESDGYRREESERETIHVWITRRDLTPSDTKS